MANERASVVIVVPVFNDWGALARLLPDIDAALGAAGLTGRLAIVDDGSTIEAPADLRGRRYAHLRQIDLVKLRRNLGHQRAIAVGLTHLATAGIDADTVVVMDGDGEDRAADIPRLLAELAQAAGKQHVVFAARAKRFEGPLFRAMYQIYRLVHWLLTGVGVRVGNFSALTPAAAQALCLHPDTWNHFAASVFRSRIPFSTLPIARGERYAGASHMRYSGLVAHGLSAIAVFSEIVGARLIVVFSTMVGLAIFLLAAVVGVRLFTPLGIPGWATTAAGLLILFAMQAVLSLLILVLVVLGDRSQAKVIPLRDAGLFIESVTPF
jgi:polyisoprenyl-phosphate glycosyltransferase